MQDETFRPEGDLAALGNTHTSDQAHQGDRDLSPIQTGQVFGDKVLAERGITSPEDITEEEPYGLDAIPSAIKAKADAQIEADRAEDDAEQFRDMHTNEDVPTTQAFGDNEVAPGIRVLTFDEDGQHDHGKKDPAGLFGFLGKILGGGATPEQQATADAVWKHLVDTVSKTVPDHAYKTTKPMPEGLPGEDVMWEWTSAEGQYSIRAQSAVFLLGQSRPVVVEAFVSVGKNWGGRIVWNLEEIREDLQEELEDVLETFGAL